MKTNKPAGLCVVIVLGCGCASQANLPLIFGQSQTVGISISGSSTDQGVELTLGYRDKNIAIVPVTVLQGDGSRTQLEARVARERGKGDQGDQEAPEDVDAFSVLGQFDVEAETGAQAKVGLGKFFATGIAARRLADGFACRMGEGKACEQPSATPQNNPPSP